MKRPLDELEIRVMTLSHTPRPRKRGKI